MPRATNGYLALLVAAGCNTATPPTPSPAASTPHIGLPVRASKPIFADSNLERAVRRQFARPIGRNVPRELEKVLREPYPKPDEPLRPDQVSSLSQLNATGLSIRKLDGIEHMTNLTTLEVDNGTLSDLQPLAGLVELQLLVLKRTRVGDLSPLKRLHELRWLNLDATRVVDLAPLAELAKLESLSLRDTPVRDLAPLIDLARLKRLEVRSTRIDCEEQATNLEALAVQTAT